MIDYPCDNSFYERDVYGRHCDVECIIIISKLQSLRFCRSIIQATNLRHILESCKVDYRLSSFASARIVSRSFFDGMRRNLQEISS